MLVARGFAGIAGLLLFVLCLPAAAASETCVAGACASDETAGDSASPCVSGEPHAPRYRYINSSATAGDATAVVTLTFACYSNGLRGEWFYGNATYSDGTRTDAAYVRYFYGEYYTTPCSYWWVIDPDQIAGNDFEESGGRQFHCQRADDIPSVVSLLP